jgi:hypothetical protein
LGDLSRTSSPDCPAPSCFVVDFVWSDHPGSAERPDRLPQRRLERIAQALNLLSRIGQINVWATAIGGLALAMIVLPLLTPFWGFAFHRRWRDDRFPGLLESHLSPHFK